MYGCVARDDDDWGLCTVVAQVTPRRECPPFHPVTSAPEAYIVYIISFLSTCFRQIIRTLEAISEILPWNSWKNSLSHQVRWSPHSLPCCCLHAVVFVPGNRYEGFNANTFCFSQRTPYLFVCQWKKRRCTRSKDIRSTLSASMIFTSYVCLMRRLGKACLLSFWVVRKWTIVC